MKKKQIKIKKTKNGTRDERVIQWRQKKKQKCDKNETKEGQKRDKNTDKVETKIQLKIYP